VTSLHAGVLLWALRKAPARQAGRAVGEAAIDRAAAHHTRHHRHLLILQGTPGEVRRPILDRAVVPTADIEKRMIMKSSTVVLSAMVVLMLSQHTPAQAQYPEDALRFSTPGFGVGSRALGMGNAYTGVANDFSAIYWNPAGLAQAQLDEFTFGVSYLNNVDTSQFFGTQGTYSTGAFNLNALGFVHKLPTQRGSFVVALGFQRQNSFASGLSFNGFNPNSSIIQTSARNGAAYPSDLSDNIAYQLYLADLDTVNGRFISPITNRVTQGATVVEGGGLNNWSIAGAMDIAPDLSLGITLTYVAGSYRYDRNYEETDPAGIHNQFPFDFQRLTIDEYVESDITGVNATFGLLYRIPDRFRLGFSVKAPTAFSVKENFGVSARSYFDNGDVRPVDAPFETKSSGTYDINSPWVYSGGISLIVNNLMLAADAEYTDWRELEFVHANPDVMAQNDEIRKQFRDTWNLRGGIEYDLFGLGVRLRGGFIYNPSPYQGDPSSFDRKTITGGLGIMLAGSTMLDLTYARGWYETFRYNYIQGDISSRTDEAITTNTFLMTFSYRF
jgi:long-subunit fatty acid transport protein